MIAVSAAPKTAPQANSPIIWAVRTFSVNIVNPITPEITISAIFLIVSLND
ncbi:MAG: hypothetical protein ABSA44_11820 [Bacteroidota bacterium]